MQMLRAFNRHELATTDWYAIAPNPMFMSYVLFILPGLALLLRSWLVLTTSVVFYILIKVLTRRVRVRGRQWPWMRRGTS